MDPGVTKIVVSFHTPFLYGMERAVIELFDKTRPQVCAEFVMTHCTLRMRLPVLDEVERRDLSHRFLPDKNDWPKIGKPHSVGEALRMVGALVKGNWTHLCAAFGKDALYVPSVSYAYQSFLAAVYIRARKGRVIHHFHDLGQSHPWQLRLWTILVTDFVHSTEFGFIRVSTRNPCVTRKRNVILPLLLDLQLPGRTQEEQCRNNIFFVGQVSRHKGIDLFLEAAEVIGRSHGTVFHIIGDPPAHFRGDFSKLLEAARRNADVRFWGYQSDVLERLASATIYVQPSPPSVFEESFGRGAVEAMALGIPVVCFRSGALQEIVIDGETGIVCDTATGEGLAEAIMKLLREPKMVKSLGVNGRKRFLKFYSPELVRPLWVNFLAGGVSESVGRSNRRLDVRGGAL